MILWTRLVYGNWKKKSCFPFLSIPSYRVHPNLNFFSLKINTMYLWKELSHVFYIYFCILCPPMLLWNLTWTVCKRKKFLKFLHVLQDTSTGIQKKKYCVPVHQRAQRRCVSCGPETQLTADLSSFAEKQHWKSYPILPRCGDGLSSPRSYNYNL